MKFQPSRSTGTPKRTRHRHPPRSHHNRRSRKKPTSTKPRSRRREDTAATHHEEDPDDYQDWLVVGNWAWMNHSNTTHAASAGNDITTNPTTTPAKVGIQCKRKRRQQSLQYCNTRTKVYIYIFITYLYVSSNLRICVGMFVCIPRVVTV